MSAVTIKTSLLSGRSTAPLNDQDIRRVSSTFLGMDDKVNVRFQMGATTRFVISQDDDGQEFGEIVFSSDIYPGQNVTNPNATLSLKGAIAHELTHFYRWQNKSELPHDTMTHIDEAMTSLEAALRYSHSLDQTDVQGLISDALQRIHLFLAESQQPLAEIIGNGQLIDEV
jgi:hypothetical protein